jgi:YidC/Oxa1 family membrane protein insertase
VGQIWNDVLQAILVSLNWFYSWTGDYGVAIILLTVAMRILLIPLTIKQTKSMYEMQEIQPKLKALQEKHKKDKEKLQEETLKFYKENKVNPFGGCLPLLIQMPVFIALFRVLGTPPKTGAGPNLVNYISTLPAVQQAAARRFLFLIADITKSPQMVFSAGGGFLHVALVVLPYATLVVLFGLSIWLPQQMLTKDKQQQRVGLYMSVFMLYIGWVSPAGVLLYWVTSSAWQVAQQAIMLRQNKTRGQGSAA